MTHTTAKLQYKLLYSLIVAGKSAKFAENVMKKFLSWDDCDYTDEPFLLLDILLKRGGLMQHLKECRTGNYNKLLGAFTEIHRRHRLKKLNLKSCTPEDLERIKGIGPKTSRFFILWTRPDAEYAALDTHILKWLRYLGYNAPTTTPDMRAYPAWETIFLHEAKKRGVKPAKLDYTIWEHCRDHAALNDTTEDSFWPKELRK